MTDEPRRVSDMIAPWIEEQVAAEGEAVQFEVGILPTPQGIPGLGIILWMASPVLGEAYTSVVLVGNPLVLEEQPVKDAIRGQIEQMRQQRSQQLSQSNGHGQPGSGLITP